MSDKLGMNEADLIKQIKSLKKKGYLRRIGAVISAKHLYYKSTLIAAQIEKSGISRNVKFINSHENVTHNYLRDSKYNVWFTFSAKTKKEIKDFICNFKKRIGVLDVLSLPAIKTFKINAEFKF